MTPEPVLKHTCLGEVKGGSQEDLVEKSSVVLLTSKTDAMERSKTRSQLLFPGGDQQLVWEQNMSRTCGDPG